MPGKRKHLYFLTLLLGVILVTAKLHCCVELNSRTMDSHVCPICSAARTALATSSLIIALVPAINRLEVFNVMATVLVIVHRNVTLRAPPAS
jgi:hypothetical protein